MRDFLINPANTRGDPYQGSNLWTDIGGQLYEKCQVLYKTNTKTGWTESFWATRATFIRVKGERRPYWQFNEPHIVPGLIMHAKTGQIQSDLFL